MRCTYPATGSIDIPCRWIDPWPPCWPVDPTRVWLTPVNQLYLPGFQPHSLALHPVASLMSIGICTSGQSVFGRPGAGRSPGAPPVVLLLYRLASLHNHHAVPSAYLATASYLFLLLSLPKSFPHASSVLLFHTNLLPLFFSPYTRTSPNPGRAVPPRCQSCPRLLTGTYDPSFLDWSKHLAISTWVPVRSSDAQSTLR